jgi:hypothetical protein
MFGVRKIAQNRPRIVKFPKNLGFGKDAVLARRLHSGNIRNGARVMFFLTGSLRHRERSRISKSLCDECRLKSTVIEYGLYI